MMVAGTICPLRTTARCSPVPTARIDDCGGLITAVKSFIPLDLYDDPANQFVAGFIGSPAMNFLSGRMARNGAGLAVAVGGGVHLPMPARSGVAEGRDVVVGVRPEHFAVADDGVPAEVVVVEPTGADTQIFCKLAGVAVTAVVRERHTFQPGAAVRLKPQLTYLFDPSSGARLA